jgi:hypothetical protein
MIPKSVKHFSEKDHAHKHLERDDDSKKSHPALAFGAEPSASLRYAGCSTICGLSPQAEEFKEWPL